MRIPLETACRILGVNANSLEHPPYKTINKNRDGVSQKDLYKFIEDRDDAVRFLCMVQGCLMFLLDSAKDLGVSKHRIAQDMGFPRPQHLHKFLQAETYSDHTARVFVRLNRRYKSIVNKYDNYMRYTK